MTRESYQEAVADIEEAILEQCRALRHYDMVELALKGDEKTVDSFRALERDWVKARPPMDIPKCETWSQTDIEFRRWVTLCLNQGHEVPYIRYLINREHADDTRQALAKLEMLHAMFLESHLYIMRRPPLDFKTTKEELYEFFYYANMFEERLDLVREQIYSLLDSNGIKRMFLRDNIRNCAFETKHLICELRYHAYIHNPTDSEQDSSFHLPWHGPKNDLEPILYYFGEICILHNVRINGAFKAYLHVFNRKRIKGADKQNTVWYTLKHPEQIDAFSRIIRPDDGTVGDRNLDFKPSDPNVSEGDLIRMSFHDDDDDVKKVYVLDFRPCTLQDDGPLPQCLCKFVPPNYRSAEDPYRPLRVDRDYQETIEYVYKTTELYRGVYENDNCDDIRANNYNPPYAKWLA